MMTNEQYNDWLISQSEELEYIQALEQDVETWGDLSAPQEITERY